MTKAEQKRLAKQAKDDFIDAATNMVLNSIGKHLIDRTKKCAVRMNANGRNRYFNFERYGEHLRIAIYRTGDIDFRFHEFCHTEVEIRAVHYENVPENPEAALSQLQTDIEMVVDCFLNYYWHAFMDYQWFSTLEMDWRERIQYFMEECKDL